MAFSPLKPNDSLGRAGVCQGSGGLPGLPRAEFLLDARSAEHLGYYRPVVLLSFLGDAALARILPAAYHLTNVLLHALNAGLVTLLARALLGQRVRAGTPEFVRGSPGRP